MGIRIKKQIGYFLPNKDVKQLFVTNYKEIMEDLDYEEDQIKFFFNNLFELMRNYQTTHKTDAFMLKYFANDYEEMLTNKKLSPLDLISQVFFYDDIKGFLFTSKEQSLLSRHDDLIDYYENSVNNKILPLNRPIYPVTGYVYQGGLEEKFPKLNKYDVIDGTECSYLIKTVTEKDISNSLAKETKKIVKSGFFTPKIEPLIFIVAKAANILKADITEQQFNSHLIPATVSTWS